MWSKYMIKSAYVLWWLVLGLALSVGTLQGQALPPASHMSEAPDSLGAASESWLEPRGLNIVDLVGRVPEQHLVGSILSYTPGYGILQYQSGSRIGKTVTITATVYPRYVVDGSWSGSMFGCLGQPAKIDQWGSVSPSALLRVYHGDTDVTGEIDLYTHVPAGHQLPVRNPRESECQNQYRYWETPLTSTKDHFSAAGDLQLPANMGCELIMSFKNYRRLTAVFVLEDRSQINVEVLGDESFTFHSYVGVGYAGVLQPLVDQLRSRFGGRHERFDLNVPAGADYFLLNFPPMPVDPYTQFPGNPYGNVDRRVGGTYRFNASEGLSVDHVNSMGLPLVGHWKDVDLSGSGLYLPYMKGGESLAAPEYFVPAGVPYDPCMISGNCSSALLDKIFNTPMEMTVVYFRVERTGCELSRVPLRMVGSGWSVSQSSQGFVPEVRSVQEADSTSPQVFLPLVLRSYCAVIPPDDPTDCPCGWLTRDGRMVDFIP